MVHQRRDIGYRKLSVAVHVAQQPVGQLITEKTEIGGTPPAFAVVAIDGVGRLLALFRTLEADGETTTLVDPYGQRGERLPDVLVRDSRRVEASFTLLIWLNENVLLVFAAKILLSS